LETKLGGLKKQIESIQKRMEYGENKIKEISKKVKETIILSKNEEFLDKFVKEKSEEV